MKIQIDTTLKTVTVEQDVVISELIDNLKKLLPNDWKEYKLQSQSVIVWRNPIQYQPFWQYIPPPHHPYPFTTICGALNTDDAVGVTMTNAVTNGITFTNSGTYQIEMN